MKNKILLTSMLLFLTFALQAQKISKNALGIRIGDSDGFGGEISYQRKIATDKRLEFDLGLRGSNNVNALKLAVIHQWIWNIEHGLNWYAGIGGGVGSWSYNYKNTSNSQSFIFLAGDLGIEYDFDAPFQISLDIRPEFYFNSSSYRTNNFGPDIALGVRYRFN